MRRLLTSAVCAFLLVAVAVVLFGPTPSCVPGQSALGVGAGVDVSADPVRVSNSAAPLTVRVASWNTLHANSTGRVLQGLRSIAGVADVIGVQELSSPVRRRTAGRMMARHGWAMVGNHAVPIFYNATKYKLLAEDSTQVVDAVRIESGTAGTTVGSKHVQWVQLQDRRTQAVFFVVNHHLVPDIDRKGHPRPGAPKRLTVYRTQMSAMLSVVSKLRVYGPTAVTGDFNVDARADQQVKDPTFPFVVMGRVGFASNWSALGIPSGGTHRRRLIDYVWLTQSTARFTGQKILGHYGSDHRAVLATITSRAPGAGGQQPPGPTPPGTALPATLSVPGLTLNPEQIQIAAAAIEVGRELGIPERGWIVAIASGLQESGLRNLPGGNRDSAGWQQQRPSAGWGTIAQIRDVRLAARAFYGLAQHTRNRGLVDIKGWEQLSIAHAAQAVQGSAFPSAYTKWEPAARAIVTQLAGVTGAGTGDSGGCGPDTPTGDTGNCPATNLPAEKVLTPDALQVLRCVAGQFPTIHSIGTYPGHQPDQSRAIDVMIPGWQTTAGNTLGNQIADWVKAHQRQLGVQYVIWDGRIWNVERDSEGWRPYFDAASSDPSRAHRNHVHVSVYGNRGTGPGNLLAAGSWHTPVGQPSRIGCGFGCYSGHTGQDYPAPAGTPVYAVTNGTVIRSESITSSGTCTTLPICGGTRISYGNLIVLRLADGAEVTAWYAHLTARRVRVGDTVRTGQVIGTVGYQGHVIPQGPRGAHLHFELRRGGTPINPLPYLRTKGIQQS